MDIAADDLDRIRDHYDRGLYLQAYEIAKRYGRFHDWKGAAARIMAGRLAGNLGARRLACALHMTTWRADRDHPEALYYHAYALLDRRGPLAAWEILRTRGDFKDAPLKYRADLFGLVAEVAASLRDFDTADHWIARSEEITPDRVWTEVERSRIYELEDRYEDALAAARRSMELRPWYRPAVQAAAHLLQLLDRDQEALALLREAGRRIESGSVMAQLAALETELGLHADARESVEGFARFSPLLEKDGARWLAARRSDLAYYCGDRVRAAEHAPAADTPFYKRLGETLPKADAGLKRVLLPVGFVRQHHMTCAPATLSAISRYWSMPAEHLAVAERICYDGTPAHSERKWAEENGWVPREFTVTWESAVALLDRGVPFTFTTVEPGSAHLQSLIGYDGIRRTLIVRDPYERNWGEFLDPEMFERYRSCGPRGMLLVPRGEAARVEGLPLPEADLYDDLYRLSDALERHDREGAARAYESLSAKAPGHRLTLWGRRTLASYDADRVTQLACVEELLKLFPDDANLRLSKFYHLREMGRREERLALLKEQCDKEGAHPIFWQAYARELAADARRWDEAERLCGQAIRSNPRDAESFHILAGILWNRQDRERALDLYRFAASLEDKNEAYAESYFIASRHLRRTAQAILFLRNRFRRFGKRSAWPARTLFWAFEQLDRSREAFEVLDEALRLRPDDGELLLFAADARARNGDLERAAELLKGAEGKSHRGIWLRTSAHLAAGRGASQAALEVWRSIAEVEPLAMDAHSNVARLLAETEGRAAALEQLRRTADRFPFHAGIHQLWIEWLRDADPADHEAAIRRLIAINPDDAWARRELALLLSRQRRLEEAFEQADAAYRLDPSEPSTFTVRAAVCTAAGKRAAAQEACRESIRLSVDWDPALKDLVYGTTSLPERREALAFIRQELIRQVIFGDGLLTYRELSKDTLEPEELLAQLKEAVDARPDLWHAWAAMVRQTAEMNRLDESIDLARKSTDRFPLVARLWVDLAFVCRLKGDAAGGRAALEQALRINPSWGVASRELASLHERAGDFAGARAVLEQAVARSPLDAYSHSQLAEILWKIGEREAAIARVEKLVQLEPAYESAWGTLLEWSAELKRPEPPRRLARELAARRAGDAQSWLVLARVLEHPEDLEERLRALARAVELDPRSTEGPDMRARLLSEAGRHDEALAECGGADAPLMLRGRSAWVEAQRGNRTTAIERMRSLLSEDPSYYWGWLKLAEWCRDENLNAEYLEASRAILRLTPQRALAFGYVGDAKLRLGDRAGAEADFARAVELAPDYGFAGFSLFDLYYEDGKLDRAAATLGTLKVQVGGVFTLAREVQLAAKRKDRDAAVRAVAELSASGAKEPWPFEAALAALAEAGWESAVEEGPACWAGAWLARARDKARTVEERLRAVDVAARLDPSDEDARDVKVVVLTEARRFDEAAAACGGADAPIALRGRAAWVEAERGDPRGAIERMRKVVAQDPKYRWGWSRLADWCREGKDDSGYLEAARELVKLAPEAAISHGYFGEALVRRGERDRARESFARALELSPAYEFAGFWLFDLQLEDGDLEAAGRTLAHLRKHVGGSFTLGRAGQLAAKRKDEAGSMEALRGLCRSSEAEPWPFETSMKDAAKAGWARAAERVLFEELGKAGVNPIAAASWAQACVERGGWTDCRRGLESLRSTPELWSRAAGEYLEALGTKRRGKELRRFLAEERGRIEADDRAWGCAGYALNEIGWEKEAVDWHSGWKERKGVKPWMLLNLAVSLRSLGRAEEARSVSVAALGLPGDHATPDHRLWVAFEEAVEGRGTGGAEVDASGLKPFYACLRSLAMAARGEGFEAAVAQLRKAAAAMPGYRSEPLLLSAYRRVVRRIAALRGGSGGTLWGWFRLAFPIS